jgi:hypothetical protein
VSLRPHSRSGPAIPAHPEPAEWACLYRDGAGIAVNVYSYKDRRWPGMPVSVRTFDEGKSMAAETGPETLVAPAKVLAVTAL